MAIQFRWEHRQPELGLLEVSTAALERAAALDWSSEPIGVRVAHLRALMVRSIVDAAILTTAPVPPPGTTSWTAPDFSRATYRAPWGRDVARMLLRTPLVLLASNGKAAPDAWQDVITSGGQPALPEKGEAGVPWLAAIAGGAVVIVGAAAWTIGMCYLAQKTAEVVDNELARRDSAKKMIATQGAVLQMVEQHTAAELAAGRELPLNAAEQKTLDALLATQDALARERGRPIPSPFPTGADVASGSSILSWLAAAAALGVAAYYGVFKS